MKRMAVLCVLILILLSFFVSYADDDGLDSWCYSDQYGCWVTDEDGGRCYIMFWSEEARAFFMGGHSNPGQLVFDRPEGDTGRITMDKDAPMKRLSGKACFIYCANLDWGDNQLYEKCVRDVCGVDNPPNVPSEWKQ